MSPDNGQYMVIGYVAVGVIYLSYAISLVLRAKAVKKAVNGER
jgi:hypothetical protein